MKNPLENQTSEDWAGRDGIVCVTSGPRQGLEALRRWLRARMDSGPDSRRTGSRDGVGRIAQVIVVVPSRALAHNISAHLASEPLCSLGLSVMTLHGLANQVVHEAGEGEGRSAALDLLVSRAIESIPLLREKLGGYRDVDSLVAQTVRDFLHAGLDLGNEGMGGALQDALAEFGAQGLDVGLARALVEAAFWVLDEADRRGILLSQQLLARAATLLRQAGGQPQFHKEQGGGSPGPISLLPPCDAFVLYGFADVTGLGLDFLIALATRAPTTLFLDLPIDPADPMTGRDAVGRRWSHELGTRPAWRFAQRFLDAMQGRITNVSDGPSLFWVGSRTETPQERVDAVWKTTDPHAEMAALAAQVRKLLDGGVAPEDIAVVFRDDSRMALDLRTRFEALAVPYSSPPGSGFGPREPSLRSLAGLAKMLKDGSRTPLDVWSQLIGDAWIAAQEQTHAAGGARMEGGRNLRRLLAGARLLGVARLSELGGLDRAFWDNVPPSLRLPVASLPQGDKEWMEWESGLDGGDGDLRTLSREELQVFLDRAARAAAWLERLDPGDKDGGDQRDTASWDERLDALRAFLVDEMGWEKTTDPEGMGPDKPCCAPLMKTVTSLLRGILPSPLSVTWKEFAALAARRLESAGRQTFGGAGGGVQVMAVPQARGCRFRYLFLPEMNQGRFPRPVSEDPLLSDALRRRLRDILDSLPVKSAGHDEELYLFCQFLGSADHLILSWHGAETDGKVAVRSSLLERLGSEATDTVVSSFLTVPESDREPFAGPGQANEFQQEDGDPGRHIALGLADPAVPRPDRDLALAWVLARRSQVSVFRGQDLAGPLGLLLEAQRTRRAWPPGLEPEEVARARARVFMEQEGRSSLSDLGPYLGMVGPVDEATLHHGVGGRTWWATDLERFARCPWQWFLARVLGLEPAPDPMDVELDWNALMLGNAFHRLAEGLVVQALAQEETSSRSGPRHARKRLSLDDLENRRPVALARPMAGELQTMALHAAEAVLQEYGPSMKALARPLAQEVMRRMKIFMELDWAQGPPRVLGAEVLGSWRIDGHRRVRFKADRVDRDAEHMVLTDYKTGGAVLKTAGPRKETQLKAARAGRFVQVAAYTGSRPGETCGRYLFVVPGFNGNRIQVLGCHDQSSSGKGKNPVLSMDAEVLDETEATVRLCMETWEAGWAMPNLLKGEAHCAHCDYRRACARSIAGGRRRMESWYEQQQDSRPPAEFLSVVWMGRDPDEQARDPESGRGRS